MNVNAVQIILIFVVTFIAAVDQFNLSESFYQPMVTGCVVGFILGDIQTGLVVGGTYQLMAIGNIPINGEQPSNVVIGGILATVFAVTSGLEIEVAIGLTIPFALLSQYLLSILFTATTPFLTAADNMAQNANVKGIVRMNYITMVVLGILFAMICVFGLVCGEMVGEKVLDLLEKIPWMMKGVSAAGSMMRYAGFAALLEKILSPDLGSVYLFGFLITSILSKIRALSDAALLLVIVIGMLLVYERMIKLKRTDIRAKSEGGKRDV